MAETKPRRRQLLAGDLGTSILLALAILVTLPGLHVVLIDSDWYWWPALLAVGLLGLAAGIRLLRWPGWLAPSVPLLALLVVLTAVFAPKTAFLGFIPTQNTWLAWNRLLDSAAQSIDRQSLPAFTDTPIMFLICLCIGLIAILCDLMAIVGRSPAVAGVPLLILLAVPGYIAFGQSDPLVFIAAVAAYLLLLRVGSKPGQAGLSVGLGVVAVVAALIVPIGLPPVVKEIPGVASGSTRIEVNPVLSLGQNLRRTEDRDVLSYTTNSGGSEYLRLVTIENFSGTDWAPTRSSRPSFNNTVDSIGPIPGLSAAVARETESTTIFVNSLVTPWLPVPYPATRIVGLEGFWTWSSDALTVSSRGSTAAGQRYRVSSIEPDPTPAQLLAAGTNAPAEMLPLTALPAKLPAVVSDTARIVTAGKATNYEKALALQSFFRDDFEYSETAPVSKKYDGTGGGVIAKFLKNKSGYCIHFASAMAVMARSLGIPARVAVGFLPGQQVLEDGENRYQVTTQDTHAWPELYFDGIGWVRFEPTASRGELPSYADLTVADVPGSTVGTDETTGETAAPTPVPTETAAPVADAGAASGGTGIQINWALLTALLVLAGLVLIALVPAGLRNAQRAARLRDLRSGLAPPSTAWNELLQSVEDYGTVLPVTNTPRELAAVLAARGLGDGEQLTRLVSAVETESYSRTPEAASYAGIADDLEAILAVLSAKANSRSRRLAKYLPPSLWSALFRLVSR